MERSEEESTLQDLKEEVHEFDELLQTRVGEFGRKQKFLTFLLASSAACTCVHSPQFRLHSRLDN